MTKVNWPPVHIRWCIRRDVGEVLAIQRLSFGPLAWDEDELIRVLRRRECVGLVAELGERVVGHMVYELRSRRLKLLTLAVHPEYRRMDVGRACIDKLVRKLASNRRHLIYAHVRESRLEALLFFKAVGFQAVAVRRGHFRDPDEDGITMEFALASSVTTQGGPTCSSSPEKPTNRS